MLTLNCKISTDGDTIYVDGQSLANILRAVFPATNEAQNIPILGDFRITFDCLDRHDERLPF
jgi:hypothetical protein